MTNRFASENNKWRQWQTLSSLRQDPVESLEHYIEPINFRCYQLDVKGMDKMRYFVQGLRPESKEEVLMRQPKSFEEAEHLARLKVAVKESIDMKDQHHRQQDQTIQMLVEKVASLSAKLSQPTSPVVAATSYQSNSPLEQIIQKLQSEIKRLEDRMDRRFDGLVRRYGGNNQPRQSQYGQRTSRTRDGRPICYTCGQAGHISRNCPNGSEEEQQFTPYTFPPLARQPYLSHGSPSHATISTTPTNRTTSTIPTTLPEFCKET